MPVDNESSSSDSDDETKKESFDDKMKRLTKLGKEGNINALCQEAQAANCTPEMIAFAARKSKELGNDAFAKKEYDAALEYYAGALVGDCPEKHKVFSNRSACFFQLGKYTDALVEATKAIKENRAWSKGYFRAGRAAMEMEYYEEALEMFEKGLEREPANKDLVTWTQKARDIKNQHKQEKLMKKHETDYSKFDEITKAQQEEEEQEEAENDPNRIILGDRYYSSSKMEQRQLKAMLGYKEDPPPPFEPTFNSDMIYRHDARGLKTQHPIWDPTTREWRIDAKPAPSRVDYSDSQQTQAIAIFLERQTDVQYVDELLHLLDEKASPIDAYVAAVRDMISSMVGPDSDQKSHNMVGNDARWLFMGIGTTLPIQTVCRYLPRATVLANTAHRAMYIADLSWAALSANGITKDQVRLIHRPSSELAIVDPDGEDINNLTGRVDVCVFDYEMFDPELLGKGILAKVNHAKKRLMTTNHITVPMGAMVMCVPAEIICPRGQGPDGVDWRAVDECRWGAFYETTNLDSTELSEPWKALGPVQEVFEYDFTEREIKLSGQTDFSFTVAEDGVLNCIAFWYRLHLTENVTLDHTPEQLRAPTAGPLSGDYYRHAQQWLAAPINVSKGETIRVRASYSRARIRFEVIEPEVPHKDKRFSAPRWLFLRCWDEQRTDAFRKAIDKALEKIMEAREKVPKLDRPPLRIVHLGAGLGQVSMVASKCLRDAGWTESDVETYGYSVVAIDQMPKVTNLAKKVFRENGAERDIYMCTEDVRKIPNQPQRAQLLISELIDPGLLGEGILVLTGAARIKMCNAFDHHVIPARGKIWAAAFELGANLKNCHGFDMSLLNHYRIGNMIDIDTLLEKGVARQLCNVFQVFNFDFENNEMPSSKVIEFTPTQSGNVSCIVFWYEVDMDPEGEIILANWPEAIPPADFSMMEKDVHKPNPNRQAVCYFDGDYRKEVTEGVPVEMQVGYTQAWPQFIWPGAELVQKESGDMVMKPPPLPRHRLYHQKMKFETEDLEKKLTSGLMYDEEMLGDGFAAAERVALEPNGNPNYMIDPNNANFMHLMFFL